MMADSFQGVPEDVPSLKYVLLSLEERIAALEKSNLIFDSQVVKFINTAGKACAISLGVLIVAEIALALKAKWNQGNQKEKSTDTDDLNAEQEDNDSCPVQ